MRSPRKDEAHPYHSMRPPLSAALPCAQRNIFIPVLSKAQSHSRAWPMLGSETLGTPPSPIVAFVATAGGSKPQYSASSSTARLVEPLTYVADAR